MRWTRILASTTVGGAVAAYFTGADKLDGFYRFGYTSAVGAAVLYDYKFVVGPVKDAHGDKSDEYKAIRSVIDKKSAERMLHVCQKHGGLYIKFAQALSTNNFALPKEYITTLSVAQDKAEFKPWKVGFTWCG
jgi:hypothetical protein